MRNFLIILILVIGLGCDDKKTNSSPTSFSVESITLNHGDITGGNIVIIQGTGFTKDMTVFFGANIATSISFVDDMTLHVEVPSASNPGKVDILLSKGAEEHRLLSGYEYTINTYAKINFPPQQLAQKIMVAGAWLQTLAIISITAVNGDITVENPIFKEDSLNSLKNLIVLKNNLPWAIELSNNNGVHQMISTPLVIKNNQSVYLFLTANAVSASLIATGKRFTVGLQSLNATDNATGADIPVYFNSTEIISDKNQYQNSIAYRKGDLVFTNSLIDYGMVINDVAIGTDLTSSNGLAVIAEQTDPLLIDAMSQYRIISRVRPAFLIAVQPIRGGTESFVAGDLVYLHNPMDTNANGFALVRKNMASGLVVAGNTLQIEKKGQFKYEMPLNASTVIAKLNWIKNFVENINPSQGLRLWLNPGDLVWYSSDTNPTLNGFRSVNFGVYAGQDISAPNVVFEGITLQVGDCIALIKSQYIQYIDLHATATIDFRAGDIVSFHRQGEPQRFYVMSRHVRVGESLQNTVPIQLLPGDSINLLDISKAESGLNRLQESYPGIYLDYANSPATGSPITNQIQHMATMQMFSMGEVDSLIKSITVSLNGNDGASRLFLSNAKVEIRKNGVIIGFGSFAGQFSTQTKITFAQPIFIAKNSPAISLEIWLDTTACIAGDEVGVTIPINGVEYYYNSISSQMSADPPTSNTPEYMTNQWTMFGNLLKK